MLIFPGAAIVLTK